MPLWTVTAALAEPRRRALPTQPDLAAGPEGSKRRGFVTGMAAADAVRDFATCLRGDATTFDIKNKQRNLPKMLAALLLLFFWQGSTSPEVQDRGRGVPPGDSKKGLILVEGIK